MTSSSKRDIPTPTDNGFTSSVFFRHQLSVRYGASLPVGHPGVGIFPAQRGATPGVQKGQWSAGHQQTRLCQGHLLPDPSPSEIRSLWRLQTTRATAAQL